MGFPEWYIGSVSELVERIDSGETAEKFTELNFNEKGIGYSGVSQLCTVLNHFTALQALYLDSNSISSAGVSVLCDILPQCTQLTELSLDENSIDDIGAKRIAETLERTKLHTLGIGGNDIGRNGICALFLSAANSQTLTRLSIHGNSGLEDSVAEIVDILPHCNTLQWLSVGYGEYSVSGKFRQRILGALQNCTAQLVVAFGDSARDIVNGQKEFGANEPPLDRSRLREIEESLSRSLGQTLVSEDGGSLFPDISNSAAFQQMFLQALKKGSFIVYRCRVAFVGDSRVGKTWTANSLRGEKNIHPETAKQSNDERTVGAESTALYIGAFAVNETKSSVLATTSGRMSADLLEPRDRDTASTSTAGMASSSTRTPSERGSPVKKNSGSLRVHDHVRRFPFPDGVVVDDPEKTMCYLTLWDFGGQLMYHSWYQFYFAPGMIPCVVFDLKTFQKDDSDTKSSKAKRVVKKIVNYAQQAVHFGGSDCLVLLVGTKAGSLGSTLAEREEVAKSVSATILSASPEPLQDRYHGFVYADECTEGVAGGDIAESHVGVCAVENEDGMDDVGVQILWKSLVRECMRQLDDDADDSEDESDVGDYSQRITSDVDHLSAGALEQEGRPESSRESPQESTAINDRTADVRNAQQRLRNNEVPSHWYEFEQMLRENAEWQKRNFGKARELWEYAKSTGLGFAGEYEFVASLASMASAGSVILTADIPWSKMESMNGAVPESFLQSTVITRPQWLIEIAHSLLPHPEDEEQEYKRRKFLARKKSRVWGASVDKLWEHAVADCNMLRTVLGGKSKLNAVIGLFESRLVFCRIHSDDAKVDQGQWFVPSMVVFHAERKTSSIGGAVKKLSESNFKVEMTYNWVPPGFPLLVAGSMLQGCNIQPRFSICRTTGMIQFVVAYPGCRPDIYIDLIHGAGGNQIRVWAELSLTMEMANTVAIIVHRILEAVHAACERLRVEPLLEMPLCTVESGLVVELQVPLVPIGHTDEPLKMRELRTLCRGDQAQLGAICDVQGTKELYGGILSNVSCIHVPPEWLSGLVVNHGGVTPVGAEACGPTVASGRTAVAAKVRLVEDLNPAEQQKLIDKLILLDDADMWRAVSLLKIPKQIVTSESAERTSADHARIVVRKCLHMELPQVEAAIASASSALAVEDVDVEAQRAPSAPRQASGCKHPATTSQAPESDDRFVKQMSALEQDDLALELTEAGKHRMWRAAAILSLNREVIQAQTTGSDLNDYAYTIVLKCRELRVSEVRDALKQASGSAKKPRL